MNRRKNLLPWLLLALSSLFVLPARAQDPTRGDAFLDRPFPASVKQETFTSSGPDASGPKVAYQAVTASSFWGGVELLGALCGKKVRLPEGLAEWPDERTETNRGPSFTIQPDRPVRKVFEQFCESLNLVWRYDAAQDVIDLDPAWRRADPRSGRELVNIVASTRPVRSGDILAAEVKKIEAGKPGNDAGKHGLARDDWRLAFDGLLSRPENFPLAGSLRLYHDQHQNAGVMDLHLVENLCAGKMVDAEGRQRIVVLNEQRRWTSKDDPGDVAYYLFDEDGRFVGGGVYALEEGWQGGIVHKQTNNAHEITLPVYQGPMPMDPDYFHFVLVNDDLVLRGSTDTKGKDRNAEETRTNFRSQSGDCVRLEYSVPAKPGG